MIAMLELAGPDNSGKSTVWEALAKRMGGKGKMLSKCFVVDRGLYDSIVMDECFGRSIEQCRQAKLDLLMSMHNNYLVVQLVAPANVLEQRQQAELSRLATVEKGEAWKHVVVDCGKQLHEYKRHAELYAKLERTYKESNFMQFDTSIMDADAIANEIVHRIERVDKVDVQ